MPEEQDVPTAASDAKGAWASPEAREAALLAAWHRASPERQAQVLSLLGAAPVDAAPSPATFEDYWGLLDGLTYRFLVMARYFQQVTAHPASGEFWCAVQNALGEAACLLWNHVFGNRKEHFHFTRLYGRPEVSALGAQFAPDTVRKRLLEATGETEATFLALWRQVSQMRNKYTAHREAPWPRVEFPDMDRATAMVEALREEHQALVHALLEQHGRLPPLLDRYEFYRANSNAHIARVCQRDFLRSLRAATDERGATDAPATPSPPT